MTAKTLCAHEHHDGHNREDTFNKERVPCPECGGTWVDFGRREQDEMSCATCDEPVQFTRGLWRHTEFGPHEDHPVAAIRQGSLGITRGSPPSAVNDFEIFAETDLAT